MTDCESLDLGNQEQIALSEIKHAKLQQYLDDHPNVKRQINAVFSLENARSYKMSPLTFFAMDGRLKHCWILCKNGADPNARDGFNNRALDVAKNDSIREVLQNAVDGRLGDAPPGKTKKKKNRQRAATEIKPPVERPRPSFCRKVSSGPIRTACLDDGKEPERPRCERPPERTPTPTPSLSSSSSLTHLDLVSPKRSSKKFKRLDERYDIREIRENLKRLQPQWDGEMLTLEMEMEYGKIREEIRNQLAELKTLLEKEKRLLLSDDEYFRSMLAVRNGREFIPFVSMSLSYHLAWINCIDEDPDWNRHVDRLTEWAERYNFRGPQIISDVVEIYPFVIITQNRVTPVLQELAEETGAIGGFHGPKPKSLARAWEKTAFKQGSRQYTANIDDWARGLITYRTLKDILSALNVFDSYEAIEIMNVHCGFVRSEREVSEIGADDRGKEWQDVKVHFRFKYQCPQLTCELQLCLAHFTNARKNSISANGGHKAYSKFRSVNEMERYVRQTRAR